MIAYEVFGRQELFKWLQHPHLHIAHPLQLHLLILALLFGEILRLIQPIHGTTVLQ
jgi:hypothetical protein